MRSKTEARWAVYFDQLGIKWNYEPEPFDFGEGIFYLPDFYLPEFKTYAEVKPDSFMPCETDKVIRLVERTGKDCICLIDMPAAMAYPVVSANMIEAVRGATEIGMNWPHGCVHVGTRYKNEGRFFSCEPCERVDELRIIEAADYARNLQF